MRRKAVFIIGVCALFVWLANIGLCQEKRIFRVEPMIGIIQPIGDFGDCFEMGMMYGAKAEMEIAEYPCLNLGIGFFVEDPSSKSNNENADFSIRHISGSLSYFVAPGSDFTPYVTFGAGNYREKAESPLSQEQPWIKITETQQRFGLSLGVGGNVFVDWAANVGFDLVGKYHVVYEPVGTTKFFDFGAGLFYQF